MVKGGVIEVGEKAEAIAKKVVDAARLRLPHQTHLQVPVPDLTVAAAGTTDMPQVRNAAGPDRPMKILASPVHTINEGTGMEAKTRIESEIKARSIMIGTERKERTRTNIRGREEVS